MSGGPAPAHVVELSTSIRGSTEEVWAAMLDAARQPTWLGGFRFEGAWRVGAPLGLVGSLEGKAHREDGVLLGLDPGRLLRYSHFSSLWRVPNTAANHAILTLTLEGTAAGTIVSLHHALPEVEAIAQHSRFFWRGALEQLRRLVEG